MAIEKLLTCASISTTLIAAFTSFSYCHFTKLVCVCRPLFPRHDQVGLGGNRSQWGNIRHNTKGSGGETYLALALDISYLSLILYLYLLIPIPLIKAKVIESMVVKNCWLFAAKLAEINIKDACSQNIG